MNAVTIKNARWAALRPVHLFLTQCIQLHAQARVSDVFWSLVSASGGCRFLSSEEVALQRRSPYGGKVFCSA